MVLTDKAFDRRQPLGRGHLRQFGVGPIVFAGVAVDQDADAPWAGPFDALEELSNDCAVSFLIHKKCVGGTGSLPRHGLLHLPPVSVVCREMCFSMTTSGGQDFNASVQAL